MIDDGTTASITSRIDAGESSVVYPVSVPDGATVAEVTNDSGVESVVIYDAEGELLGGVAPTEVVDATGVPQLSTMSVEGDSVVLEVAASEDAQYPVRAVAAAGTVWYSWASVTGGSTARYIVNANPTALGRQQIAWNLHATHVAHVKSLLGTGLTNLYWNWNIEQQFVCHVVGAYFPSGVYNMESWQPALSWGEIANPWDLCNRIK